MAAPLGFLRHHEGCVGEVRWGPVRIVTVSSAGWSSFGSRAIPAGRVGAGASGPGVVREQGVHVSGRRGRIPA